MLEPIVALATPPLKSALAVIRISGEGCFDIVSKIFSRKITFEGKNKIFVGDILDGSELVDEVVLLARNAKCRDKLHDIMCVGRKYGCYFVLCLQDATKDTIGKCKMNCPQVIGLGTNDETEKTKKLTGTDHQGQFHVWCRYDGRGKLQSMPGTCVGETY
jgi:hypothetical protein